MATSLGEPAGATADGAALPEQARRALEVLVETGDLDRLLALARVLGGMGDALSDDMVTRLAALVADGLNLLDRANRSEIANAFPVISALVRNGDLDRLAALARVLGGMGDALSDDIVTRLAETASNGLVLIDRVTRRGLADRLIGFADQVDRSHLLEDLLAALARTAEEEASKPRPGGGLGGLWQIVKTPEAQGTLRYAMTLLGHFRALRATSADARA